MGGVFFRAVDIQSAWHLLVSMAGLGAPAEASRVALETDAWAIRHGYASEAFIRAWFGNTWTFAGSLWLVFALAITWLVPDTMEIVDYREGDAQSRWRRSVPALAWRPSYASLGLVVILVVAVLFNINRVSEFLYYQF